MPQFPAHCSGPLTAAAPRGLPRSQSCASQNVRSLFRRFRNRVDLCAIAAFCRNLCRSMAPALLVEFGFETLRRPRFGITMVAPWTRLPGAAAGAGVLALPRSIRMVLANPAAILTNGALHWLSRFCSISTNRSSLRFCIRSSAKSTSLLSSIANRRSTVRVGSRGPGAMYSPKTRLASSNARSRVSWSVVHGTHNSLTGFKRAPDNFVPLGERLLDPFQRWMTSVLDLDLLPPKD